MSNQMWFRNDDAHIWTYDFFNAFHTMNNLNTCIKMNNNLYFSAYIYFYVF